MHTSALRQVAEGITLAVRVTPRAGRNAVSGLIRDSHGDARLRIQVTAAPSDGDANEAVIHVLAVAFGVAKSAVTIRRGQNAREKLVAIRGEYAALSEAFDRLTSSKKA